MFARCCTLFVICLLLLSVAVADAAQVRMPPGSFITAPVNHPADLANLIEKDRITAIRYTRHYGMAATELAQYFREHVNLITLDKPQTFNMFFIAKNGNVLRKNKRLPAGTKVFAAWNGQILLDLSCGNPVTTSLPKPPPPPAPAPAPAPAPVPEPEPPPPPVTTETEAEPQPLAFFEPEVVVTEPVEPEPLVAVLTQPPIEMPVPVSITPTSVLQPQDLLIPLLGTGAIGLLMPKNDPIPEPAGLLVLGMGGASLLFRYRYRKHNRS